MYSTGSGYGHAFRSDSARRHGVWRIADSADDID
jgi:hypothetical protein